MAKVFKKKAMSELKKAGLNDKELDALEKLHDLYRDIKKLDADEGFYLISFGEVADHFAKIENAILERAVVRKCPSVFGDEKKKKSDKKKKK